MVLVLALGGAGRAPVKDPVGVYGVIERVVFEPDSAGAERVQVWGVFALAHTFEFRDGKIESIDFVRFHPAERGYLYYSLKPAEAVATRSEWAVLAEAAGTGTPVAFGSRVPPDQMQSAGGRASADEMVAAAAIWERHNGRVRPAVEQPSEPDPFPLLPGARVLERAAWIRHPVPDVMRVAEASLSTRF
jgi:hypothetical protein